MLYYASPLASLIEPPRILNQFTTTCSMHERVCRPRAAAWWDTSGAKAPVSNLALCLPRMKETSHMSPPGAFFPKKHVRDNPRLTSGQRRALDMQLCAETPLPAGVHSTELSFYSEKWAQQQKACRMFPALHATIPAVSGRNHPLEEKIIRLSNKAG